MPHDDNQLQQLLNQDPNRPWYRVENAAKAGEKTRASPHLRRDRRLVRCARQGPGEGNQRPRRRRARGQLNSPGGQVWDGIAIMNALRAHRATVRVHVDGMAASIASVIAMGRPSRA